MVIIVEFQKQMLPRGRVQRYAPGRNMPDVPMPGIVGGMLSPYDIGGLGFRDVGMSQSIPIGALASALANATPEQQRMVCSLNIYICMHFRQLLFVNCLLFLYTHAVCLLLHSVYCAFSICTIGSTCIHIFGVKYDTIYPHKMVKKRT